MKKTLLCILIFAKTYSGYAQDKREQNQTIALTLEDCVLIKYPVPEKGIVCSNYERALRLSNRLENVQMHKSAWGPFVAIGSHKGEQIFVGCAPIGTGAGLVFTELFTAGAKYIIRYGSEDAKAACAADFRLVKILDEADNLFGFAMQSGVAPEEWGQTIQASSEIVESLTSTAKAKGISYEKRICHHMENYHSFRSPTKFLPENCERIKTILQNLHNNSKPSSFDMETAVLLQVAKDFGQHAATVLQTINKEGSKLGAYEGENYEQARRVEEDFFFDYVLESLIKLNVDKEKLLCIEDF